MADQRHEWFMGRIFRHRGALHRYVSKLTSGAEDIEDLVQETYLRIYALPDFDTIEVPKALLFRIAHNLVVERARRKKAQLTESVADLEDLSVFSLEAPPDEQTDARRRFECFCAAVDRLPPLCRRVFVLRKVFKLSPTEISEVLDISTSTIEKHVAKGLVRCRDYLREKGLLEVVEGKTAAGSVRRLKHQGHGE
jgi:RNA polymerase sigma factor (sigma-70 family)